MCMVHYSFMVQAFVWENPRRTCRKPRCCHSVALADHLRGQQPLLPYSGYVLDKLGLLTRPGRLIRAACAMIQNFLNGQDENWFVLIQVLEREGRRATCPGNCPIIEASAIMTSVAPPAACSKRWVRLATRSTPSLTGCRNAVTRRAFPGYGLPTLARASCLPTRRPYEVPHGEAQAFRDKRACNLDCPRWTPCASRTAADPLREYLDQAAPPCPPATAGLIDDWFRASSQLRTFVEKRGIAA